MHSLHSPFKSAALAIFLAQTAFGNVITVIDPCPAAPSLHHGPITVTSQYQPVSTCGVSTACVKGKCSSTYGFETFPFVSTVVPHAWNGTTSQTTTITKLDQPFRISEHLETLTAVETASDTTKGGWLGGFVLGRESATERTVYETVTRRAFAPFSEVGSFAVPGWRGSGLCKKCQDDADDTNYQLLDVIECRNGEDSAGKSYQNCHEWYETWVQSSAPTSSETASVRCSSNGQVNSAGIYTWTFPQAPGTATITAPARTVTVTVGGKESIKVDPEAVHTVPGRAWNAFVTKSFSAGATFNFDLLVTKVLVFSVPHSTQAAKSTREVSVPNGGQRGGSGNDWPLSDQTGEDDLLYGDGNQWADWNPATTTSPTSQGSGWTSRTSLNSAPTWTSSSSWTSSTSSTSSSSSGVDSPIQISTTTSTLTSSSRTTTTTTTTFGGNVDSPIMGSTTTTSTSSSASTTTTTTTTSLTSSTSSSTTTSTSSTSSGGQIGPVGGSTTSSSSATTESSTTTASTSTSTSMTTATTTSTTESSTSTSTTVSSTSTTDSSTSTTDSITSTSLTTTTLTSTSATTTTSSSAGPICNLNANICLNSNLIIANTLVTQACPLLGGLLCTVQDLLNLVPPLLSSNPNVNSIVIGNNQILGLGLTPQQLQTAINLGQLNQVCNALQTVSVVISDPTCPTGPASTTTTFTTTVAATTTTSAAATTTTATTPSLQCGVSINLCLGQTLADVGLATVTCSTGVAGLLCSLTQVLTQTLNACVGNCRAIGRTGILGINLTGLVGTQTVQQVQAAVGAVPLCLPGGQTVVLSDPGCPSNLFKRSKHRRSYLD